MRKIIWAALWGILLVVLLTALGWPRLAEHFQPAAVIYSQSDTIVRLYRHDTDQVELMPLEDYITGVVAAEMPAEFPRQALMAQAVAARTYIYKRMMAGGVQNRCHTAADTCDDHNHAQAWISRAEMKERWGIVNYYRYYYKIRQAVDDSAGEIITYQGEPIDPVYHASCGGCTENSEDVWKFAVPYLRSVNCPHDTDPRLVQQQALSLEQVEKALDLELQAMAASTGGQDLVRVMETTATGRPKTLLVGDQILPAADVRYKLNLRSTNFTTQFRDGQLIFSTTGYGHGVGLCQYGARGLADNGYDYRQIIKHYYTGVDIANIAKNVNL